MTALSIADVRSSLGSELSPIFSDASSPVTNSSGGSSPLMFESDSKPSRHTLEHNPEFFPFDRHRGQSCRPVFENPRPAPLPPRQWRPNSVPQFNAPILAHTMTELTPPTDDEGDVCEDAEDFLQFLTRSGLIAAERRTPSTQRSSLVSRASRSRQSSMQNFSRHTSMHSSRPTSGAINLSRPSSVIVNSRQTSIALRRGSSGVIPPILQQDTCFVPSISFTEPMAPQRPPVPHEPPPMKREDNLSKLMSHIRMSSEFATPPTSIAPPSTAEEEPSVFLARRQSSVDFSDLEFLLAQTRNEVLTQLHKAYTEQFETMAHQIAALTREVNELKRIQNQQIDFDTDSWEVDEGMTERKSNSVPNGRESQLSMISIPQKSTTIDVCPAEAPFWKASLTDTGEEWDHGDVNGTRRETRCISPMTVY
jgi:hypothetical protein